MTDIFSDAVCIYLCMCFCCQTLYDEAFISLYNVCYTSLPILALGIFDQVRFSRNFHPLSCDKLIFNSHLSQPSINYVVFHCCSHVYLVYRGCWNDIFSTKN